MTLAATTPRAEYVATAGQTIFDYTWAIFETSDLVVEQNDVVLTEGVDYTVDNIYPTVGGAVTLLVGASAGDIILIYSAMPFDRSTDFSTAGDFLTDALNEEFDRMIAMLKQISNPPATWQQPFMLGSYSLWVDSTGVLRIDASAPASDTDGTVVGSQT